MKTLRVLRPAFQQICISTARPFSKPTLPRSIPLSQTFRSRPLVYRTRLRRPYSTANKPSYNPTPHLNSPESSLSLSQRLRKLSREYGWSAFGIYLLLSALDFPFCFAAVRYLGTDRIGHYEHVVLEQIRSLVPEAIKERWRKVKERSAEASPIGQHDAERGSVTVGGMAGEEKKMEAYGVVVGDQGVGVMPGYDHGVEEAEKLNKSENASKWFVRDR